MTADSLNLTSLTFTKLSNLSYRSGELKAYLDTICENIIEILREGIAAGNYYENRILGTQYLIPNNN